MYALPPQIRVVARLMEPAPAPAVVVNGVLEGGVFDLEIVDTHAPPKEAPSPAHLLVSVQHALAALCFSHRPMCYLEPKIIGVFVDRILPDHLMRKPGDTTVATEMGRRLNVNDKTTRQSVGNTEPSKPELSSGIRYRHIQIHAPPSQYAGDRALDDAAEERLRKMYHSLKSALSGHPEQVIREMKWDWAMVQGWFASSEVKKRSKKVSLCNIVLPPLSFIMIQHVAYRVIINDALADEVVGRVLDPRRAVITGCHVVEQCGPANGVDEDGGVWEVSDEAPEGQFSRTVVLPPGQHFRTEVAPTAHEHVFFWALEFALCAQPRAPKSPPPARSNGRPLLHCGARLSRPNPCTLRHLLTHYLLQTSSRRAGAGLQGVWASLMSRIGAYVAKTIAKPAAPQQQQTQPTQEQQAAPTHQPQQTQPSQQQQAALTQ